MFNKDLGRPFLRAHLGRKNQDQTLLNGPLNPFWCKAWLVNIWSLVFLGFLNPSQDQTLWAFDAAHPRYALPQKRLEEGVQCQAWSAWCVFLFFLFGGALAMLFLVLLCCCLFLFFLSFCWMSFVFFGFVWSFLCFPTQKDPGRVWRVRALAFFKVKKGLDGAAWRGLL